MDGFRVGQELVVNGRWMIVEDVSEDGTEALTIDQEGQDYNITLGDVDHFYD